MTAQLILGAYTAAASDLAAHRELEESWYRRLREQQLVSGLELAWDGTLHPDGTERIAELVDPDWRSVVTLMPRISVMLPQLSSYGIASEDPRGRELAVADVLRAREDIARLQGLIGAESIRAVLIPSAPSGPAGSSSEALAHSLSEILRADWGAVTVLVEHADAADGVLPQKAFLPVADEIAAVASVAGFVPDAKLGHLVNWARSVIERHSEAGAEEHLRAFRNVGRLNGLMFSGVAPVDTVFGAAWADVHLPVADAGAGGEPESLLTSGRIARALEAAGPVAVLGAKVSAPKRDDVTLEERLAPGFATLAAIARSMDH